MFTPNIGNGTFTIMRTQSNLVKDKYTRSIKLYSTIVS